MKKPLPFHLLPLFLKKEDEKKNAVFLLPIPNEKRKKEGKRNRAEIMKNRMSGSIHFLLLLFFREREMESGRGEKEISYYEISMKSILCSGFPAVNFMTDICEARKQSKQFV